MNTRSLALASALVIQQPFSLSNLTDRAVCTLTPSPQVQLDGNRIRSGLWGNLRISSNPWTGTDRAVLIDLYERLFNAIAVPDAPIFSRQELASFRNHLADDVERGYAAFYDTDDTQVVVYALTMRTIPSAVRSNGGVIPFTINNTFGMIAGGSGACRDAIVRHIKDVGGTIQQ